MTEKRLIVTMACGEKYCKYLDFTGALMQKYARRCNADFYCMYAMDDKYPYPGYQKWEYLKLLPKYDRILHLDTDMVVRDSTPNLFEIVKDYMFAAVDELPFQNLNVEVPPVCRRNDTGADIQFYVNVGMFLFSYNHPKLFGTVPHKSPPEFFKEQTQINRNLNKYPELVHLLPPEFNFMKIMENAGLDKSKAHIVHYAGNWGGLTDDAVLAMMRTDYLK